MTAFSISSLTYSGAPLAALRGIATALAQSEQTFSAVPQPISPAAAPVVQQLRLQIEQSQVQQQALSKAGGIVNTALKGATDIATQLTKLRDLVNAAAQPGTTTAQLQSLAQQFNAGLSSIASSIQGAGVAGINLLNGTNVQSFPAAGLSASDLKGLNLQSGVFSLLTANSLQNALTGGGNPLGDLISRIETAVKTNVGQASDTVVASFANQFVNQAATNNPTQVLALGNQLVSALGGQSAFDQQTQRLVGRILDSIGDNAPQSQTTALINQLVTNLQNAPPASGQTTNLRGADFTGANLQGTNFAGVDLTGANFEGANLQGVNFAGAILTGANFEGANLQGANLQNASIQGAYFGGADLQGTIYQNAPPPPVPEPFIPGPPPPTGQSFERQNLNGGNFTGQNLQSADFERSRVQNADFANTNLAGASFEGANAQGANFGGANLQQADFSGANLQGANFQAPPGGGGTGGGAGSGGSNFATVLGSVDQAISTVARGLDVLNREAQAIKDQSKASSDLTSVLNKEIGGLVNGNLTAITAKVSSLQIAYNLGLRSESITGQRARGLLQTLMTGQVTAIPQSSDSHNPVSSTATQVPNQVDLTNGNLGNGLNPGTGANGKALLPPISSIPSSVVSTALNIHV